MCGFGDRKWVMYWLIVAKLTIFWLGQWSCNGVVVYWLIMAIYFFLVMVWGKFDTARYTTMFSGAVYSTDDAGATSPENLA